MIEWIKPNGNTITTNASKLTIEGCVSMGFKRRGQVEKLAEIAKAVNPDKGSGEPGSYEWNCNWINQYDDKQEIAKFILDLSGDKLDQRGSIEKVREKAIALLESD